MIQIWFKRYNYPTRKGSKVPWTGKSTTPPPEDCNILLCLTLSRSLIWLSFNLWLAGTPLSRCKVAGKEDKTTVAWNTTTAIRIPAGKSGPISLFLFLLFLVFSVSVCFSGKAWKEKEVVCLSLFFLKSLKAWKEQNVVIV